MAFCAPVTAPVSAPFASRSNRPPRADRSRSRYRAPCAPAESASPSRTRAARRPGCSAQRPTSSACVGRRFSSNCCTFQPPATISHAPGFIVRAAARMRPSASSSERAPIQLTSVLKLNAARMAWRWESISPGMTVRPRRSITRVPGPASFRMSADDPTAACVRRGWPAPQRDRRTSIQRDDLAVEENGVRGLGRGRNGQGSSKRRRTRQGRACARIVFRDQGAENPEPNSPCRAVPAACPGSRG